MCRKGVPVDDLLGFVFETLLDERAVKQIKECARALRDLFDDSADKLRTQRAILKGVANLVTLPKHGEAMLKKTPAILMALYVPRPQEPHEPHEPHRPVPVPVPGPVPVPVPPVGGTASSTRSPSPSDGPRRYEIDLLEEAVVVKWHPVDDAGKRAHEAAAPFIKWLEDAEEDSSEESAPEKAAQAGPRPKHGPRQAADRAVAELLMRENRKQEADEEAATRKSSKNQKRKAKAKAKRGGGRQAETEEGNQVQSSAIKCNQAEADEGEEGAMSYAS